MTALPTAIDTLLNDTAPFDQLSAERKYKIGTESDWVYLAKDSLDEFIATHSKDVCVIHSGQFLVDDNESGVRHLSEGDIFGFAQHIQNTPHPLRVEVDVAGLILCIPPELFALCMQQTMFARFFKQGQDDALTQSPVNDAQAMWMYRTLGETQHHEPICIDVSASIFDASKRMTESGVSSLLVTEEGKLVGILTDRDLRSRVLAAQRNPDDPVTTVMTENPHKVQNDRTVFDAMCVMNEHAIHHLPIVAEDNITPAGIITATDVIRLQRSNVLYLVSELGKATSLYALSNVAWQIPHYFASNAKRPSDFDIAGKVLSQATDIMTRKLIGYFEQANGPAPMAYAWLVYGSQAREDQTLGSDQDNALLLAEEPNETQASYFAQMASYVCEGLHKCGIKLCSGNIMASNPQLRVSLKGAITEAQKWVREPTLQAILHFNIYLDVRHIAGNKQLFDQLAEARSPLLKQKQFVAALARQTNDVTVPLSLFNRFVYTKHGEHEHCIDVKTQAVAIINSIVRNYALSAGVREPSTIERLKVLPELTTLSARDAKNLKEIWLFLNRLRWRHQIQNSVTDNFIRVDDLSSIEKHQLKQAFKAIERAQQAALNHFAGGMG
ncbi:CBS domain-containing protein [Alteromonas sediminis]|uniref:CBS domain-containing protein n=1 Tax=Alteromonas sediminis TaxID=2259342 RepID=A0A3N5XYJ1_9ALTE|nr:putative nucleotidyltransferase substrate binding domain-containing protein [Alteromonas sediminis]RPJ66092.1 CBS domain-containing protein [Alteromonas sediminis]